MRKNATRVASIVALLASLSSLVASFAKAGLFASIHISSDLVLLSSSVYFALIAISLGVFSRRVSMIVRRTLGRFQIVFSQGIMPEDQYFGLVVELNKRKIYVWNDISDLLPGDDFFEEVESHLYEADALVVVNDPDMIDSQAALIDSAVKKRIRIIPILKEGDATPDRVGSMSALYIDQDAEYLADAIADAVRVRRRY
jgi:hypothetical protein